MQETSKMAKRKPATKALDDDSVDELLRPMKKTAGAEGVIDKDLLITTSLLDQIDFHCGLPIGNPWKASSLADLKGQLSRAEWSGSNKFTKRGMAFESKLCTFIKALPKARFLEMMAPDCICDVAELGIFYDLCRDGKQQAKLSKNITVDGQKFYMYGKADILFPTVIQDIKTTSTEWKEDLQWGSDKKYRDKSQHTMYAYMSGILEFNYLVAQFVELPPATPGAEPIWKVIAVHKVDANTESVEAAQAKLEKKIRFAMEFLRTDEEMWLNYTTVFSNHG